MLFSLIAKLLMKLEHDLQDTYDRTFFNMICRISFSHNYCIEKSAIQVSVLSSLYLLL
jgi:hypothetical protein